MIILLVVLLNAVIGMTQEAKAEQALEALKKLSSPNALVRRTAGSPRCPAAALVPGDIVLLEAGRVVPADLRLLPVGQPQGGGERLTGESVPRRKGRRVRGRGGAGHRRPPG